MKKVSKTKQANRSNSKLLKVEAGVGLISMRRFENLCEKKPEPQFVKILLRQKHLPDQIIWAEALDDGTYSIQNPPLFTRNLFTGDIIRAKADSDGLLRKTKLVSHSGWTAWVIISPGGIFTKQFFSIIKLMKDQGGWFESYDNYIGCMSLPPDTSIEARNLINKRLNKISSFAVPPGPRALALINWLNRTIPAGKQLVLQKHRELIE